MEQNRAQKAYEAFCATVYQGQSRKLPWEDLPPVAQRGWEMAIAAAETAPESSGDGLEARYAALLSFADVCIDAFRARAVHISEEAGTMLAELTDRFAKFKP